MKPSILAIAILMLLGGFGCRQNSVVISAGVSEHLRQQASFAKQGEKPLFSEQISTELRTLLYDRQSEENLPGVVLYVATSDGVWMEAVGKANLETKVAIQPTDRFRIASLSKMFTAVVCLQLAEEGRLDLDQSIDRWLPKSVSDRIADTQVITMRQLLHHTSSLADPYNDAFREAVRANPTHKWTAAEVLNYIYDQKAPVSRGTFSYSNANYLLLELIINQVTGYSLAEEIRERIDRPLKLNHTYMELQESMPGGFVQGYQDWNDDGKLENVTKPLINDGLGLGDGGLVSNAPDLARFFQALFNSDRLLQPDSLEQMLQLVRDDQQGGYGLGIIHRSTPWGEAWGHTGKTMGFSSIMLYLPVHDLTLIVWTNTGDPKFGNPSEIAEQSLEIILGAGEF